MDRYPASTFRDSSQVMVDELRHKLEVKSFESAYTYYHTENYKSAVIAFENALKEYPDTPFREQMQWLIVDSYFQYAELSTERRKLNAITIPSKLSLPLWPAIRKVSTWLKRKTSTT